MTQSTHLNGGNDKQTFERLESAVRGYCRAFPTVFETARGHELVDERGRRYIDFFAGAGALSYGHNEPHLKAALVEYLMSDGVTHSLDLHTSAKRHFLERLDRLLLKPRGLEYRVMFPGPTGTNAVESALKIARKVTGRMNVVSFTNGFHGMTLGSLAVTGNASKRRGAHVPLPHATAMPFCGYFGDDVDTLDVFQQQLEDGSSGLDKPAAVIVETVQAEGGVNVASVDWLKRLRRICSAHEIVLVVDDIQVGCGRTGPFFSFERAGIEPDVVTLSKSLSGYGTPLSVVLIRPDLDRWKPGEHNGTFRGHNLAFVTAAAALERYWSDDALTREVERKAAYAKTRFDAMLAAHPEALVEHRGLGLIQGIVFRDPALATAVSREAFERGVVMETAGPDDEVLKLLCPLTIPDEALARGLDAVATSLDLVARRSRERASQTPMAQA
ncbi:MAG: diaminobutyrate--2-oxoglutarate transaminase [Sandaracinaceae bacterium]|nr:diaminobutyrate--2-oxoglutarate transaminase [Sandaracinaceae bacterium]